MHNPDALLQEGIALARAGQKEQAYAVLRRALFITGDDATLRVWLGATAPTLEEALTHLERAVALEPGNTQAHAGVQWVQEQMGTQPPSQAAPLAPVEPQGADTSVRSAPSRLAGRPLDTPGPDTHPAGILACPNCGMRANPGDRFCLRCGRPLAAASEAAGAAPGAGGAPALDLTIAPPPRSLSFRPLAAEASPAAAPPAPTLPEMEPPQTVFAPKSPRAARQEGGRAASRLLPAVLVGAAVVLLLGLVGVYVFAIRPAQQSSAEATAVAIAASAHATATVAATATQGAIAQATARRQATMAAAPTVTAQARAEHYFSQIATILQQVIAQDTDIEHTMEGVQNGILGYDVAATQFKQFVDDSAGMKGQLAQLSVPPEQRRHHQQMTEALAVRGQGVIAGQQFIEDLADLAYAVYKSEQADKDLKLAQTACAQTKARADCNQEIIAQRTYDDTSSAADRARIYAEQSLQDYNRQWQQYKQLMPTGPSGGDQQ
jgi:tetratricopeptide (TPR) repeat protein